MRGAFDIKINSSMEKKMRINAFANEPISYYLHRKGLFFKKLKNQTLQQERDAADARDMAKKLVQKHKKILKEVAAEKAQMKQNVIPQSKWKKKIVESLNQTKDSKEFNQLTTQGNTIERFNASFVSLKDQKNLLPDMHQTSPTMIKNTRKR